MFQTTVYTVQILRRACLIVPIVKISKRVIKLIDWKYAWIYLTWNKFRWELCNIPEKWNSLPWCSKKFDWCHSKFSNSCAMNLCLHNVYLESSKLFSMTLIREHRLFSFATSTLHSSAYIACTACLILNVRRISFWYSKPFSQDVENEREFLALPWEWWRRK